MKSSRVSSRQLATLLFTWIIFFGLTGHLTAQDAVPDHLLGARVGSLLNVSGTDDAFGSPISGGLFYEVRDLFPIALYPQLRLSYSHFSSQDSAYGASSMLTFGAGVLFEFARLGSADLPIALGATGGYKHYLRWLDKDQESHTTFRPMPYAGMDGRLTVGNSAVGARSTVEVAMDDSPQALLGLELYYGYEFGGAN